MKNSYLNYLSESLGIEDFILPPALPKNDSQSVAVENAVPDLAFYVLSRQTMLSPEAHELLKKMTHAMGRTLDDIPLLVGADPLGAALGPAKVTVVFSDDEKAFDLGNWTEHDGRLTITTYSPELLVQQASLKKPTWAHLQDVMRRLQQ